MEVKITYPLLPLRDIVVFPSMVIPLFVGRDKSITALNEVMKSDKKIHVGKITGAHGIKGWLKIISFTSPPENIIQYSSWIFLKDDFLL